MITYLCCVWDCHRLVKKVALASDEVLATGVKGGEGFAFGEKEQAMAWQKRPD